jgi:hypothetical protein
MWNGQASPHSAPDCGQITQEIERISGLDLVSVCLEAHVELDGLGSDIVEALDRGRACT